MAEIVRFSDKFNPIDFKRARIGRIPVVIPAHNSENRIGDVIRNLGRQPLPEGAWLDIYVCANACRDRTAEIAKAGLLKLEDSKPGYKTHVIVDEQPGQAQALNTMVKVAGSPDWVIEQQDDSFASMGAIARLAVASALNPNLGVIGVVNEPLPTYRGKNGTTAERIMFEYYKEDNFSKRSVVDRLCAFRPGVVGTFPNVVSVDSYMVMKSIGNSGKFGLVNDFETKVFFRTPNTELELLQQQDMYVRGTTQMISAFPEYSSIIGEIEKDTIRGIEKIRMILGDKTIPLGDRLKIIGLKVYAKIVSKFFSRIAPYTSSKRSRILSSV